MSNVCVETNRGVKVYLTDHAALRLRERNNWKEKTAARLLGRIYEEGKRPDSIKGYLKDWVNEKLERDNNVEMVLYGDSLYLFDGTTHVLITVYPVPCRETRQRVWNGVQKIEYATKNRMEHEAGKRERRQKARGINYDR